MFLLPLAASALLHIVPMQTAPSGSELLLPLASEKALQTLVARNLHQPTVVHFWATWCSTCVQEMPRFLQMVRAVQKRGVRFLIVSVDEADARSRAVQMLKDWRVDFPTYVLGEEGQERVMGLFDSAWRGDLPATFVYDAAGKRLKSVIGQIKDPAFSEFISHLP